jgi:Domain of unknown function (DUF4314)
MAVGDRVELIHCSDPYTRLEPGARGTVALIDAWGPGISIGTTGTGSVSCPRRTAGARSPMRRTTDMAKGSITKDAKAGTWTVVYDDAPPGARSAGTSWRRP